MTTAKRLLELGRIEQVESDLHAAQAKVEDAERHLKSADIIRESDPEGAYALLYDAARKAIDALMLADGYRVAKGEGGHVTTGEYAIDALSSHEHISSVQQFDAMRRQRNKAEYGTWQITTPRLKQDLEHAQAIVAAVTETLRATLLEETAGTMPDLEVPDRDEWDRGYG